MGVLLVLPLLFIVLSTHELGHAFAMKRNGVIMEEICIFGFGYKLFSFKLKSIFGNTPITIRAIPFGAFVTPNKFSLNRLKIGNLQGYVQIVAAGASANFIVGAICKLIVCIYDGILTPYDAVMINALLALGFLPKRLGLLFPFIGIAFVSFAFMKSGGFISFVNNVDSIVSLPKDVAKSSTNVIGFISYLCEISISVGLFNCIPLGTLDGGKILLCLSDNIFCRYKKQIAFSFNLITAFPLLALFLYSLGRDVLKLFNAN